MAATDDPLKSLFDDFPQDFAQWMLDKPVKAVKLKNMELAAKEKVWIDRLLEVTLGDDRQILLHVEFQVGFNNIKIIILESMEA